MGWRIHKPGNIRLKQKYCESDNCGSLMPDSIDLLFLCSSCILIYKESEKILKTKNYFSKTIFQKMLDFHAFLFLFCFRLFSFLFLSTHCLRKIWKTTNQISLVLSFAEVYLWLIYSVNLHKNTDLWKQVCLWWSIGGILIYLCDINSTEKCWKYM